MRIKVQDTSGQQCEAQNETTRILNEDTALLLIAIVTVIYYYYYVLTIALLFN